jgi:hypothetical protein
MAVHTILDLAEAEFEEELGPDLFRAVEHASFDKLSNFQERARDYCRTAEVAAKASGQLRPYVPLERHNKAEVAHGLYLRPSDFKRPDRVEHGLDALKHHLLYCHSLAIDDPLPWLLDAFTLGERFSAYKTEARAPVVNCLRFLHQIEPLLRARVVVLVENPIESLPTVHGVLRDREPLIGTADFSDISEEMRERLETHGELARMVYVEHADVELARGLEAVNKHTDRLDLYLPYLYYQQILRAVAEEERYGIPEWPREAELRVLGRLLSVRVPRLARLEPADIVSIRQSEAGFERWRNSLERGLRHVSALDPESIGRNAEELRLLRQELLEECQALESDIEASRFLSHAKRGAKEFAIGAVVALGLIPLAGPVALAGAAGTSGLRMLWNYAADKGERKHAEAVHRQYLLFSPAAEPD